MKKRRFCRFRESALFRRLFQEVVARCTRTGLVGGEGFAIDASVIEVDAHLKRHLGFRRLRLRGITGATDEFLLAATVQNLGKLVRF